MLLLTAMGEMASAGSAPMKSSARPSRAAAPEARQAAPCPRGTWKDDPVCFGEDDKDGLPTPSANSAPSEHRAPEATIKPTAAINPRPAGPGGSVYQSGIVYQSNGNAVTSNYGGGVTLQLPF